MFRKKTLNKMPPKTKKLALACNQAEAVYRSLKRQVEVDEEKWKGESAIAKATENLF